MPPTSPAVAASNRLTAAWAGRHLEDDTVLSGLGVWVLLAALEGGAVGPALGDLQAAVGLGPDDAMAGVGELVRLMRDHPALHAALGLWFADEVPVERAWLDALPERTLGRLTGDLAADQDALDSWANSETGGEIERLPIDVTEATKAVLASALSVRTTWTSPFTDLPVDLPAGPWAGGPIARLTRVTDSLDDLRVADDGIAPLTMVRVEGTDDIDVWLLLGGPDAPPETVLADGLAALGALDDTVPGGDLPLGRPGPGVEVIVVESTMPTDQLSIETVAFDVAASHDLLAHADLFGLGSATDDSTGHFPGISTYPLAIDQGRQDALARFSAEGFVAAAVTAFGLRAGSIAPTERFDVRRAHVTFDRPFGFAAVHRPSELIVVAGWVSEPASPPAADQV